MKTATSEAIKFALEIPDFVKVSNGSSDKYVAGSQRDPGNKHNHSSNSTLIANVLRTKTRKSTLYNQVWFLVTFNSSPAEHVAGSLSNENIECSLTDCSFRAR